MIQRAHILAALLGVGAVPGCDKLEKRGSKKDEPAFLPFYPNRIVGCGELSDEDRSTPSLWLRFVGPNGVVAGLDACVTSRTYDGAWRDFSAFQQTVTSGDDGCVYLRVDEPNRVRRGRVEYMVIVEGGGYLGARKGIKLREGVREVGVRVWKGPEAPMSCGRPAHRATTPGS